MPYRLRKSESINEGCRRILFEQTASIISGLSDRGADLDERIHDVRRRFKRLRALLDLVPFRLEEKALAARVDALRGVARKLAPARDATVVLEAFDEIAVEFTGGAIERIRELLTESVKVAKKRSLAPDKLAALASEVRVACEALGRAGVKEDGWHAVGPGIFESYRKARKQCRTAFADPDPVKLHDCRTLAKRLWEQLRILRRAQPKSMSRLRPRLEKFSEMLGRHHDFFMLQKALAEAAAHGLEVAKFPPLHKRLQLEMGRCLKRTRKLAVLIFDLRPKAFASRIHSGWKDWHAGK